MSKRLKYAKLRLAGSNDHAAALPPVVTAEPEASEAVTSEKSCKKSKFFTTECSSQNSFVGINANEASNFRISPKRTVSEHEVCLSDEPKMPRLRKQENSKGTGVISHFLNMNNPEDDDFEEAKHSIVFQPKQAKIQRTAKKTKVLNKPKNQPDIRKTLKKYNSDYDVLHKLMKDHCVTEQIDPDQLQTALAMSRSLVDQKCNSSNSASSNTDIHMKSGSCASSLEDRRIVGIRTTLEQFGFRCKNSYTDYDLNVIFGAGCKNVKKIKYKRATNLHCRTKNELTDFIDRQFKTIFPVEMTTLCSASNVPPPGKMSSYLSDLFWIAQTEQTSSKMLLKYYVPELLEANPAPVGCLLKDWRKIPGRETTPERDNYPVLTSLDTHLSQECSLNRGPRATSPDLFDDFEESGRMGKVTESEKCTANGISKSPLKHTTHVLFIPSEEQITVEPLAENKSDCKTLSNELVAVFKSQPADKQESNCLLFNNSYADEMNDAKMDECTNINLHRSAENMFEETDNEPIISFEVYSSEEEKISSDTTYKRKLSKHIDPPSQKAKAVLDNEKLFDPHVAEQPFDECITKIMSITGLPKNTKANAGPCGLQPPGVEKGLSFNRIAIQARIREAFQNNALKMETVDLEECSASDYKPSKDGLTTARNSNLSCPEDSKDETEEDALYISDDEVNYSVRELSRFSINLCRPIPATDENDLDRTDIYYSHSLDLRAQSEIEENEITALSHQSLDNGILAVRCVESISPTKNDIQFDVDASSVNCTESTFAYLDSLIKQYSLPPLKSRETCDKGIVNSNIHGCSKPSSFSLETNKSANQFAPNKFICLPSISDEASNDLEKDNPHFKENDFKAEMITTNDNTDIECRKDSSLKMCCTTTACSGLRFSNILSNRSNVKNTKDNSFVTKFQDLKKIVSAQEFPSYLISVMNFGFEPPRFEHMPSSDIERELFKFGLKDLGRAKAIKMLNHLFEKTHLLIDLQDSVKRSLRNQEYSKFKTSTSCINTPLSRHCPTVSSLSERYHKRRPCAFELDPNADIFLPVKPRKKIAWNAVPLHISFFNLVSENVGLQRQILLYQPIDLDEIYSVMKDVGLRYETKDLIAFLDKYCITFRCTSSTKQN